MVMATPERFPRRARLLRPDDFARVYGQRRSAARGPLVLYAAAREGGEPGARLGISVSRRIGNAVIRNAWKRRLREAFRRVSADLATDYDYIVVVRSGRPEPGAAGLEWTQRTIVELMARLTRPGQGR
jgi:ribonuclease P protein component